MTGRSMPIHDRHRVRHGNYVVARTPSPALRADKVFVPSLQRLDQLSGTHLARLAWTMGVVCGASDFAMACFSRCDSLDNGDFARRYLSLLAECGLAA
jgi:hypothetical protein